VPSKHSSTTTHWCRVCICRPCYILPCKAPFLTPRPTTLPTVPCCCRASQPLLAFSAFPTPTCNIDPFPQCPSIDTSGLHAWTLEGQPSLPPFQNFRTAHLLFLSLLSTEELSLALVMMLQQPFHLQQRLPLSLMCPLHELVTTNKISHPQQTITAYAHCQLLPKLVLIPTLSSSSNYLLLLLLLLVLHIISNNLDEVES
jgi:hypothetical protein